FILYFSILPKSRSEVLPSQMNIDAFPYYIPQCIRHGWSKTKIKLRIENVPKHLSRTLPGMIDAYQQFLLTGMKEKGRSL
ncbi:hypothetical protein L9F63_024152, partial [Diploptera punctata]